MSTILLLVSLVAGIIAVGCVWVVYAALQREENNWQDTDRL